MGSILIQNGLIVDGTGREPFKGNVLLSGDRIAKVGNTEQNAECIIDAAGKIVCPGFIDIHRHCDAKLLQGTEFAKGMLAQGITTTVTGNCGMSLAPSPAEPEEMYDFMEAVLGSGCAALGIRTSQQYRQALQNRPLPVNTAFMAGTGSIKITVRGFSNAPWTEKELAEASALVEEALAEGAVGISAGIMYLPECYSTAKDFGEILKPLGKAGKPLCVHIRGEGDSLVPSVQEVLEIGKIAGCPVEISHFKCCGVKNWRKGIHQAIACIDEARAAGQDVTCDFYPYEGGSTALTTMLPPSFVAGDMTAALSRLGTPEGVEEFRKSVSILYPDWDNYAITLGWERILISGVSNKENEPFLGLSVADAAKKFGFSDGAACAAYLMHSDAGKTAIINLSMCQDDIDTVARLPYSVVISDSIYADTNTPHPRMYGAFPKILREYVRERKVLSLQEAVAKMTSRPAARMGLKNRGILSANAYADLLIFDPARFRDNATFADPTQFATGLDQVFLNGKLVLQNGCCLEMDAGSPILR